MTHKDIQWYFFAGLSGLVFILILVLFLPFLKLFAVVGVIAIVFHPLYEKIRKSLIHNANGATFLTISVVIIIILIPTIFFTTEVLFEAKDMYENIGSFNTTLSVLSDTLTQKIQVVLPDTSINLSTYLTGFLGTIVGSIGSIFSSILYFITIFFLGIISLFFFLRDGQAFIEKLIKMSPLDDTYDKEILTKQKQTINSIIKGSVFVAGIQGLCAWIGFMIFGVPNPALLGAFTLFAALIPSIGTALVVIPAAVYLFYTGAIGSAIGLAIWGIVIVGLVDNVVRPILVGREINIHPFLILISVFGGLIVFGPLGLLLGPLLLAFFSSLIDLYPKITKRVLG